MADRSRTPARPGRWVACGLILLAGCATLSPAPETLHPSAPPRDPLAETSVAVIGRLLELEDRREFAEDAFAAAAEAEEPAVRAWAALAAGRIGTPPARSVVRRLLADEDSMVLASAAFAAGALADTAAMASLVPLLDPVSAALRPTVAAEAAGALGRIGTPEAKQAIADLLAQLEPGEAAVAPLAREALIAAWRAGIEDDEVFLRWSTASDPEVRWAAVYGLVRPPRGSTVPHLILRLDDPDAQVRSHAIRGLSAAAVGDSPVPRPEVLDRLIQALEDDAYAVRVEAIRALGSYEEPDAVVALAGRLALESFHEVVAAAEALSRIGTGAAPAAAELARLAGPGPDPQHVRAVAVEALVSVAPGAASELLSSLMDDPSWRVRTAAVRAYAGQREANLPQLSRLARDPDPRVAAAALDAAVEAAPGAALPGLRPLLLEALHAPDVYVRAAAARGLGRLSDPATYPFLLDAFDRARTDIQNEAALAVIDAIAELRGTAVPAPERAFFARFSRSIDYLVRQRVAERFGATARAAWGEPLPVETGRPAAVYHDLVDRWIAPPPGRRPLPRVLVQTEVGEIELLLFADDAPLTTSNFLTLAAAGYFDGQEWPRVVPNFVAQGGDPRGDTSGGPGYSIRDEVNRRRYRAGTIGMALAGPDTGGSQFFITLAPQPHLDGRYAVFGEVVRGHEVLQGILPGHRIISVRELEAED